MKSQLQKKLQELTGKKYILVTNRCNTAIEICYAILQGATVAILDQGGWTHYKRIAKKYKITLEKIKTNASLALTESQECENILLTEPAGYARSLDRKKLHAKNLFILDCSGSIGQDYIKDYNADILLASFGKWKPVNLKYGGLFATNNIELFEKAQDILNSSDHFNDTHRFKEAEEDELLQQLEKLPERYLFLQQRVQNVITDLQEKKIPCIADKHALVVLAVFSSNEEKEKIIAYCQEKDLPYTECPRYIRYEGKAISIEVKRMEE